MKSEGSRWAKQAAPKARPAWHVATRIARRKALYPFGQLGVKTLPVFFGQCLAG